MAILERLNIHSVVAYDDDPDRGKPLEDCRRGPILLGNYYPKQREAMAQRFQLRGCAPLIDPSAIIGPECHVGLGSVVGHQTTLVASVRLGNHVHVGYHVGITRTNVADYSTISPGAIICGDCEIGEAVFVGASATICDRSVIGNDVVIAAGSVIPPLSNVPDGTKVIGVWKD